MAKSFFAKLSLLYLISQNNSREGEAFTSSMLPFRTGARNVLKPTSHQQPHSRLMCGLIAAIDDIWNGTTTSYPRGDIALLNDYAKPASENPTLVSATSILHHRGPDGMTVSSGMLDAESFSARWAMGHTRLAIIDPNNRKADMPFQLHFPTDESGKGKKIKLAANGEIYNHEILYNELVKDGWSHERTSLSDCEVIGHAYAKYGGPVAASKLDGMFAFVIFEEDEVTGDIRAFAARDPVGIKPLYYGRTKDSTTVVNGDGVSVMGGWAFSSELKALVGHVEVESVVAIPPGHYWTPETGMVCYYNPDWLRKDDHAPWEDPEHSVTDEEILTAFTKAIRKRMMADVEYGFFLSGGVDSAVVSNILLPLWREDQEKIVAAGGEAKRIPTFTVGMANSPDVMAAKGVVEALGGDKYIDHQIRYFTPDEVFDTIPKIIYHMETYEAELIRSSIPNWFLAERAAQDVKMVLTGEGSDELFAGYLYFQDCNDPTQLQNELKRIYNMLGNINLHRTDRMTMAHGLEARVPFLDTEFTKLVMSVNPKLKMVDKAAVKNNSRGREKTMLRELFEKPNANGDIIPHPVLWRAKAMQCEGVGEDWVSILQKKIGTLVTDEEMDNAAVTFPVNTPHTKEELYYRKIYEEHFHGLEHVVKLWPGGGRAMGAAWKSDMYTREGLKDVNLLTHALQSNGAAEPTPVSAAAESSTSLSAMKGGASLSKAKRTFVPLGKEVGWMARAAVDMVPRGGDSSISMSSSAEMVSPLSAPLAEIASDDALARAKEFGYSDFEGWLTAGADDRCLIQSTGANKYHIKPQPIDPTHIFRGSCTGNPPTKRGYNAAKQLVDTYNLLQLKGDQLTTALTDIFETQRSRLATLLHLPQGAQVILCPSGSDAEYVPIAIVKSLYPNVTITNGITQLNEIGKGSAPASVGRYFSTHAPFLGDRLPDGDQLEGFDDLNGITIPARHRNGSVVDATAAMTHFTSDARERGHYPIVHGVFGGKTGVRDDVMPSTPNVECGLGVVDACQGRFTREEMEGWMEGESVVLFTGSKFYQAPPFCGGIILPPRLAQKLSDIDSESLPLVVKSMLGSRGLGAFLSEKELPSCLNSWKQHLKSDSNNNIGLALRWEAGLAGMEALNDAMSHRNVDSLQEDIERWSQTVRTAVEECGDGLVEVWCVESGIISVRVAATGQNDRKWMSVEQLRELFKWMSLDVISGLGDDTLTMTEEERTALSTPSYIGQPVDVSEDHGIVRIAIGVESLLDFLDDEETVLREDRVLVTKLRAIAKFFDALKKSGL